MSGGMIGCPPRLYRQRDPRWASDMLGFNPIGTPYTIGNYGCLITCLAALCDQTPAALNVAGRNRKLFGPLSGIALSFDTQAWAPGSAYRMAAVTARHADDAFPRSDFEALAAHVETTGPAILEVQWPKTRGQHFILAIAAPPTDGRESLLIADPERQGQVEELSAFFGSWAVALVRAIYYAPNVPRARGLGRVRTDVSPEQRPTNNNNGGNR